jgi:hypothetical protein
VVFGRLLEKSGWKAAREEGLESSRFEWLGGY